MLVKLATTSLLGCCVWLPGCSGWLIMVRVNAVNNLLNINV